MITPFAGCHGDFSMLALNHFVTTFVLSRDFINNYVDLSRRI